MPAAPAPLTDAEITELDDLLAAVPEPLEPLDAVPRLARAGEVVLFVSHHLR